MRGRAAVGGKRRGCRPARVGHDNDRLLPLRCRRRRLTKDQQSVQALAAHDADQAFRKIFWGASLISSAARCACLCSANPTSLLMRSRSRCRAARNALGQHRKPDGGRRPHRNGVDAGAKEAHDRLRTIQNKPDGMNGEAPPASSTRSSGAAFACASMILPCSSVAWREGRTVNVGPTSGPIPSSKPTNCGSRTQSFISCTSRRSPTAITTASATSPG
jgi:hypothetical protein